MANKSKSIVSIKVEPSFLASIDEAAEKMGLSRSSYILLAVRNTMQNGINIAPAIEKRPPGRPKKELTMEEEMENERKKQNRLAKIRGLKPNEVYINVNRH